MEANVEQKDNEIVDLSCPVADVQKIVHGKWSMVLIYFLSKETLRFGELKRKVPYITEANLTKELRMLEHYGLVHREVYREVPPKVEYSLTEIGREFLPVIKTLSDWATKYREYMRNE
jgi:DNA-binding HxlR family transcriptional regulator